MAAVRREQLVLPVLVQQRPPCVVEVNREAEREGFESQSVRRARINQPETADGDRLPIDRNLSGEVGSGVADDRRVELRAGRKPLEVLTGKVRASEIREEHAANAA